MLANSHKLAVDIDGVIANFVDSMLPYMNAFFGTDYNRDDVTCFDFHKAFKMEKEEFNRFWPHMEHNNLWCLIKPMQGAVDQLQLISETLDFEYVTSRPTHLEPITRKWLDDNGFPVKQLTLLKNKKDVIDRFSYFIDDRLEDCLELATFENVYRVLLFDSPWNQMSNLPTKIIRVKRWNEVSPELFKPDTCLKYWVY